MMVNYRKTKRKKLKNCLKTYLMATVLKLNHRQSPVKNPKLQRSNENGENFKHTKNCSWVECYGKFLKKFSTFLNEEIALYVCILGARTRAGVNVYRLFIFLFLWVAYNETNELEEK